VNVLDGPMSGWQPQSPPHAVTIGVFDGVHIGHRLIIDQLRDSGLPTTVLTFDPHPAEVLAPGTNPRLITTIGEREKLLERAGVDTVGILDLAEVRYFEPDRFVTEVLLGKLGVRRLVIGRDFHFGRNRSGDVKYLLEAGARLGFEVVVTDLVERDGVVSSTRIRGLIEGGEVAAAASLLGSRYRLANRVVHGEKRGRDLGFPTANLEPPECKVIPGHGIYAAIAGLDGETHPAAVNVGVRPTFGGTRLLVEAYLLDFDGDLYGRWLTLEFVDKLRAELEFENIDALVEQMGHDVTAVRQVLNSVTTG
jgi:riboflavin kinase/FMN adenylyltransferase